MVMTSAVSGGGTAAKFRGGRLLALLLTSTTLGGGAALGVPMARAQQVAADAIDFNIPAQPLASAISAFIRQSGWQISYSSALVRGQRSTAVSGRFTPAAALRHLVAGSGLEVHISAPGSAALSEPGEDIGLTEDGSILLEPIRVDTGGMVTEGSGSYTSGYTTVATGLPLTMRETPQSISVTTSQEMEDQNMTTITDVLEETTGVTVMPMDSERRSVYARGFSNPTYMVDGLPVWYRIQYGSGPSLADMAIYDRVEILRGATGLMAGAGDPSVAINMVRKSPTSAPQTRFKYSFGSWNTTRAELDTSGPITKDGGVRGRFVAAHEDGESYLERYEYNQSVLYGTVEADVGDRGLLTFGVDYQRRRTRNAQFGGLPLIATDGSQLNYEVGTNSGGGNLPLTQTTQTAFTRYKHTFDNSWELVGDLSYYQAERKGYLAAASWGSPTPAGFGAQIVGGYADTDTEQTNASLTLSGPVELWGRSHDLRFGVTGNVGTDNHKSYRPYDGTTIEYQPISGSIFDWDGTIDNLIQRNGYVGYVSNTEINHLSAYGSGRFHLSDRLSLIGGARVVWYEYDYTTEDKDSGATTHQQISRDGEWIPYAGLVYDLNENWSAYASYSRIFKQPSYRDKNNRILDPTTGSNYEIGVKSSFFNDRLNFAAAVFLLEQDKLPSRDRSVTYTLPDGSNPYKSIDGATTSGIELELGGEISLGWEMAASYAYTHAEDGTGARISTVTPEHSVKLATAYTFGGIPLTIGGNIRWQSKIENAWTWPVTGTAKQGAYAVAGLMARYDFGNGLMASLNIDNLFDEKYLSSIDETYATGNYGAPLNATFSISYSF